MNIDLEAEIGPVPGIEVRKEGVIIAESRTFCMGVSKEEMRSS